MFYQRVVTPLGIDTCKVSNILAVIIYNNVFYSNSQPPTTKSEARALTTAPPRPECCFIVYFYFLSFNNGIVNAFSSSTKIKFIFEKKIVSESLLFDELSIYHKQFLSFFVIILLETRLKPYL